MEQEEQKTIWVPASVWRELRLISLHEGASVGEVLKKHFGPQIARLRSELEAKPKSVAVGTES